MLASGLMLAALLIWPIRLSAYAQEYCPSGQVVTAQSQCAGAVGPVDNLTKSILRLNGSGFYNVNKIPISQHGVENNTERNSKVYSNLTAAVNTTAAANVTNGTQSSKAVSRTPTGNTTLLRLEDDIFRRCLISSMNPLVRSTLTPSDIASVERAAIQNLTGPLPYRHVPNVSLDQWMYGNYVKGIKPIADCMRQELTQKQQNQQQPPYQQPPFKAGSNSGYASTSPSISPQQPQLQQGQPLYNPIQVVACLNHVLVDSIVKAGTSPNWTLHNNSKGVAPELNQTFIQNATQTLDSCIVPISR